MLKESPEQEGRGSRKDKILVREIQESVNKDVEECEQEDGRYRKRSRDVVKGSK